MCSCRYGRLLNYPVETGTSDVGEQTEEHPTGNTGKVKRFIFFYKFFSQIEQLAAMGVTSVFDILRHLSRRDPDLCVQALSSLLGMLQSMPADSLRNESKTSLEAMISVLRQLREEGGCFHSEFYI